MLKKLAERIKNFIGINTGLSEFIVEPTFFAELNSKARRMIFPAAIFSTISWIPFLFIDTALYPQEKIIIFLRSIVILSGFIVLVLSYIKFFKKNSYIILFSLLFVISFVSGMILGIVKGDPVYMGGYSIVLLIIPFIPLRRTHSLITILNSFLVFFIIGLKNEMNFSTSEYLYGLFNVILASLFSLIAVYFFDKDRKTAYGKNFLIQQTNEALENSNREISFINESIAKTSSELNIANNELKNVINLKSEFLHIAAHDLKNPLQVILGYVEILNHEINQNSEGNSKLKKIENSVEQMIEIISKLLESEEIEMGNYIIKKKKILLNDILKNMINKNLVQANKKQQKITLASNKDIHFEGDSFILKQVFENLISNAIKFSPNESEITIYIKENQRSIVIAFQDEGLGLSELDFTNLFKKFKKLSVRPTNNENSSGLGLSIVKRYVEMHNGKVYAKNNKIKGTTFFVELII